MDLTIPNDPAGASAATATVAGPSDLADAIAASIRELTKLRGEVALVEPGSLPNDGKVIEDLRKYQ